MLGQPASLAPHISLRQLRAGWGEHFRSSPPSLKSLRVLMSWTHTLSHLTPTTRPPSSCTTAWAMSRAHLDPPTTGVDLISPCQRRQNSYLFFSVLPGPGAKL